MNTETLHHNKNCFYGYRFLSRFYMYLPILAVVLYKFGLSYLEIAGILAVHGLAMMLAKIPLTKVFEKGVSNRRVLMLGEVTKAAGVLGLGLAGGRIEWLLVAQIIGGIGFALTSSTESALLMSAMKAGNAMSEYRAVEARSQGFGFLSIFLSGVIGSIVAAKNIPLAIYLTVPFSLLSALVVLFFREPEIGPAAASGPPAKTEIAAAIGRVRSYLLYYALNRGIVMAVFVLVLPIFLMKAFTISLAYFGAILGVFSLTAYFIGTNFEKISARLNGAVAWVIPPLALMLAVGCMLIGHLAVLPIIPILLGIAASMVRPLAMGRVNQLIKAHNSQVMSRGEQYFGILNALFLGMFGYCLAYHTLIIALWVLGAAGLIINGPLVWQLIQAERAREQMPASM